MKNIKKALSDAAQQMIKIKHIGFDADLFIPTGAPNYEIDQLDPLHLKTINELSKEGHEIYVIAKDAEEANTAKAMIDRISRKHKLRSIAVQLEDEFKGQIPLHVFITDREANVFFEELSHDIVHSDDSNYCNAQNRPTDALACEAA